jgi:hypothetical protein
MVHRLSLLSLSIALAHHRAARRAHPGRAQRGVGGQRREARRAGLGRPGRALPVGPRAQPEHRVVSFGRAFPRFYIRGYGNTDFRLNASQPVSLVYDDVVQENPILKGFPAFDLSAVEVRAARRARCSAATRRPAW